MPTSDDRTRDQPIICQTLGLLKEIRATQADLARLRRKRHVARGGGRPLVSVQAERDIIARERRLIELARELRTTAPAMFSDAQCNLPAGQTVKRQRGPTGALITLYGGQDDGLCRLTIANVGLSEPLDLRCRPQDVNLIGYLLADVLATDVHNFDDIRPVVQRSRTVRRKSTR